MDKFISQSERCCPKCSMLNSVYNRYCIRCAWEFAAWPEDKKAPKSVGPGEYFVKPVTAEPKQEFNCLECNYWAFTPIADYPKFVECANCGHPCDAPETIKSNPALEFLQSKIPCSTGHFRKVDVAKWMDEYTDIKTDDLQKQLRDERYKHQERFAALHIENKKLHAKIEENAEIVDAVRGFARILKMFA